MLRFHTMPIRFLTLALVVSLISGVALTSVARPVAAVETPTLDLAASIVPTMQAGVEELVGDRFPHYAVTVELIPSTSDRDSHLIGSTTLTFVNFTPEPVTEIYLRLYPNSPFYLQDNLTLSNVRAGGRAVTPALSEGNSLATIPLGTALPSGESIEIGFDFVTTIPTDSSDGYAMLSFDTLTESYNIAYWQPLLAGWTAEDGWNTGVIQTRGDPVFSNTASFTVELTAPAEIQFATTGSETGNTPGPNGTTTRAFESGPVRDFVMIGSRHYDLLESAVDETTVRSFTFPEDEPAAQLALNASVASLEFFNQNVGTYPYLELDIAESDVGPRAAGIEFPGLVYIDDSLYRPDSLALFFTIAHEVAHQYFYNLIGNDQYRYAFLDEALATYVAVLIVEDVLGVDAANMVMDGYLLRPYLATLYGGEGDAIVDQPTADFASDSEYGRIVYAKGGLGMHAIREEIGLEAFLEGMRIYLDRQLFDVATPADLLSAFEAASGADLQELWSAWFEEMHGAEEFKPGDVIEIGG